MRLEETRSDQGAAETVFQRGDAMRVIAMATVVLAVLVFLAPVVMQDPFIRSDDYSQLLGEADRFWLKTLEEGRWVSWLWTLRPVLFDPIVIMVLFLSFWSLTAAATAWLVFRDDERLWRAVVFSVLIGIAPTMAYFSTWPATGVPSMAVLAAFAVFAAMRPGRAAVRAFWVFVPLGLMTYTSAPFAMLLIAAISFRGNVNWRDAAWTGGIFVAAFGLGVLLIFTLNWLVHGVFGVPIAAWREASPLEDLQSLIVNLGLAFDWLVRDLRTMGLTAPLWTVSMLVLFAVAMVGVLPPKHGRGRLYVFVVLLVVAMAVAMVVRTGVVAAFRSSLFLYLAIILTFALAARQSNGIGRGLWVLVAAVTALPGALHWIVLFAPLSAAQAESRAIAAALNEAGAKEAPIIHIVGDPQATPYGGAAQGPEQLGYRVFRLTGRPVRLCLPEEPACAVAFDVAGSTPVWPMPGSIRALPDGALLLHLPRLGADADVHRLPVWTVHWTEDGGQGRARPE